MEVMPLPLKVVFPRCVRLEGSVIVLSAVQPTNIEFPKASALSLRTTCVSDVQLANNELASVVNCGKETDLTFDLVNALAPMLVRLGRDKDSMPADSNAFVPSSVTPESTLFSPSSPTLMVVRAEQFLKTLPPMPKSEMPAGSMTVVSDVQPENKDVSLSLLFPDVWHKPVTPAGILIEVNPVFAKVFV